MLVAITLAACTAQRRPSADDPSDNTPEQAMTAGAELAGTNEISSTNSGRTTPAQSAGEVDPPTAISSASSSDPPCAPEPLAVPAGVIPEGAAIGWTDCGGLWAVGADGRPVQVTDQPGASEPRFSPDRRQVAFQVNSEDADRGLRQVFVAALGGTGLEPRSVITTEVQARQIPSSKHMPEESWTEAWFYDWLPDGTALAFTTVDSYVQPCDRGTCWGINWRDDLWVLPVDGGEPRQLLPPGQGGHFVFSPDGQYVATTRDAAESPPRRAIVAVANADGSDSHALFEHPAMSSGSDWRPYQMPRWSPDSQSLLVVSPAEYPGDHTGLAEFNGRARLLRLNLDGDTETIAEAGPGSLPRTNDYNAWWSPDGHRVAFLAPAQAPPLGGPDAYPTRPPHLVHAFAPDLVIAGLDGSRAVHPAAAPPELNDFAWSPDGERYSYPYWDRSPDGAIRPGGTRLGSADLAPRAPAGSADWRETAWLSRDRLVVATGDGLVLYRITEDLEAVDPVPIMTGAQPAQIVAAVGASPRTGP